MSVKEITGLMTIFPENWDPDSSLKEVLQAGNIAFRSRTLVRTIYFWDNNSAGANYYVYTYPFKNGGLLDDADLNTPHGLFERAATSGYPYQGNGTNNQLSGLDYSKFRATGSIGTSTSGQISRVHAGLCAFDTLANIGEYTLGGNCLVSASDLPADYTQIGIVYAHPIYQVSTAGTGVNYQLVTTAGQNYATFTNAQWWDQAYITPSRWSVLRIASGADAGVYFIENVDWFNNRLYLRNLDGSPFVAQGSATLASTELYMGPGRTTYFNEVSIIPFSTGTVVTGGRFVPLYPGTTQPLRSSFICKVKIEKTGSDESAAAAEQQGSYTIGLKPWTHGEYDQGRGLEYAFYRAIVNEGNSNQFLNHVFPYLSTGPYSAGANVMVLDEKNMRCWVGVSNNNNDSCILHWRWRTIEGPREVAVSSGLGTAASSTMLTPTPALAPGDIMRGGALGSDQRVYMAIQHATLGNGGLLIIKPDLTTLQYNETTGFPESNCAAAVVDKTRYRSFSNVDTTAASNTIIDGAGTTFTNADIGRCIKVLTGADAGNYLISVVNSTSNVTVTNMAGGAVSFTGSTAQTAQIGDGIYLFFNNGTTGAGKINYMESLVPGTFLTRTVAMTNGANCNVAASPSYAENQKATVDPSNGNIYWLSNDTQQQINKYDPLTNTHSYIAISDAALLNPPGGVARGQVNTYWASTATPTSFTCLLVNSKFDELWVGSTSGTFKIPKSTFAVASTKRYWGAEQTPYVTGVPLTTGTGNGTTGLSFSTPTVTLNATGTPFTANDVGKWVMITGATAAGNNGVFQITTFNSSSSISFTNSSGATQANYAGTFYIVKEWAPRSEGNQQGSAGSDYVRNFWEHPDGRVCATIWAGATAVHDYAFYSREADTFVWRWDILGSNAGGTTQGRNRVYDSLGWFWDMAYGAWSSASRMYFGSVEVTYQWTGSAWTPRETALAGTPNKSFADTTNPLCAARPIHSTLEDLMYGVKIQFTKQGGATPSNNEFLGRMGQVRTTSTTGVTTASSPLLSDGGWVLQDVGRIVRIESGSDAGIYQISSVVVGVSASLKTMDGRTLSAIGGSGLTYTVWDIGSVGSNAGPEEMTFVIADGVSKDNTQDITGFTYEAYHFKTRLHENDEGRKFCVENPLAVPGSIASKVYFETYARASPQYDAALSHHLPLPGSEFASGRQVLDGVVQKYLNGTGAMSNMYSNPANVGIWYGTLPNNNVLGYSLMVDFGADVEVGYALLRVHTYDGDSRLLSTASNNGIRASVYRASNAGGTPLGSLTNSGTGNGTTGLTFSTPTMTLNSSGTPFTAGDVGKYIVITGASTAANNGAFLITAFNSSSSISYTNASGATQSNYAGTWYITPTANVRTTGTSNFNCTVNVVNSTALTTGNFLGPTTLTPTTPAVGAIVSGGNTLSDTTNAQFLPSHVGQILQITAGAGADIASYRIVGYTSSSVISVRNLDQTAKAWTVSSSSVTYIISDGVQAEDMIIIGNGGHRLCVERLLTTNTLQLRTAPNATITSQSWLCVKPTWKLVKKISHSVDAVPPDVKNNGTWAAHDGREAYSFNDVKFYMDFNDLSSAERTGRYWKWAAMPRFDGNSADNSQSLSTWEFYDTSGNRLATSKYTMVDESRTNPDYFFNHINRFDFIQAADDAMPGGTFNGNVDLGGGGGDTLTLNTGGNKFLGFQVGPSKSDGVLTVGTNYLDSASSNFPAGASVGRLIRITSGTHAGEFYRVASRDGVLATRLLLVTPSGGSVSWGGTESSISFSVHSGINVGGVSPDKFVFLEDGREFTLLSINDTLTTLTISETGQVARTNKTWEIRRPGYDTSSTTTEATKTARLTRPLSTYPVQSGDMLHDGRGTYLFFSEDIGTGFQRADGVIAGGDGFITGSGFTADDVGRLLYIVSGTGTQLNNGIWEIDLFSSSTSVRVKNHYTGAAAVLTADAGPVTYQILGDRRFRLTRFVVGLRA